MSWCPGIRSTCFLFMFLNKHAGFLPTCLSVSFLLIVSHKSKKPSTLALKVRLKNKVFLWGCNCSLGLEISEIVDTRSTDKGHTLIFTSQGWPKPKHKISLCFMYTQYTQTEGNFLQFLRNIFVHEICNFKHEFLFCYECMLVGSAPDVMTCWYKKKFWILKHSRFENSG